MAIKESVNSETSPPEGSTSRVSGSESQQPSGVKVRMYRQGLGDCFLITLPRSEGKPYFIMIDCGVILGTPSGAKTMQDVVNDIILVTHGHIDLLLATHEHWDHLSGFLQAKDLFAGLTFDKVWLAWTEDPNDELANKLRSEHSKMQMALAAAAARMRFGGADNSVIDGFLEFFGTAGQGTTRAALELVKGFCQPPRYCRPEDAPVELQGCDARLYVLGPPHNEKQIKRSNPSKAHPETYDMTALYVDRIAPVITDGNVDAPFDPIAQIPLEFAQQMSFFQAHYWGEDNGSEERDQSWRRIDGDWLDPTSSLALQLDSATNNTSLVLAIELIRSREVLLFVADAQVGNWLSWQDLTWNVGGETVTGPDLLRRTILYKVGHHGSHNATLQEKGLDLMKNLRFALIPVDHEMAVKKRWGKMPLEQIEKRLNDMTKGAVLRADRDIDGELAASVAQDQAKRLYFELTI